MRKKKILVAAAWAAVLVMLGTLAVAYWPTGTVASKILPLPTSAYDGEVLALDLNTATAEQLDELPGIGPVLAQSILDAREENGPFRNEQDVMAVKGIGPSTYESIRPYIALDAPQQK